MKRLQQLLVVLTLIAFSNAYVIAQSVTITPANATGADEITLTYDANAGCTPDGKNSLAGLANISLHSGCNTWMNVVEASGQGADGSATMVAGNGDGTYSITFTPDLYYGVEANELNFVFNQFAVDAMNQWDAEGKDGNDPLACADFTIVLGARTSTTNITNATAITNTPNPFTDNVMISYNLLKSEAVTVTVMNALGQPVKVLVNANQQAGVQNVTWDASEAAAGMYYYRLTVGEQSITKPIVKID